MQSRNATPYVNFRAGALRLLVALFCLASFGAAAFGQAPTLALRSNVSLFDFGRFNTGTLSPNTVITIANGGAGSVTVTNVTITGVNSGDFTLVATTCINAVLTTNTCTATVRFNPLAIGTRNGNLTVTDTANGSQHLVPLRGTGLNPNIPNEAVGPIDARTGFPMWYQDEQGRKLQLCLDSATLCLSTVVGTPQVNTNGINFPGEAFYWSAESSIARNVGDDALLVLAKEAAFTTEDATVGEQITFDRIRVRIDALTPGANYTITHPFGVMVVQADVDGEINTTTDIGCGGSPCDFRMSLNGANNVFLRWDPLFAPAAPAGYLGDPNTPHRVTGSPTGNNIFKVDGPNVGGAGINSIQTVLFTVSGKIF
ncbi:MAG TPA: choice-of-anchor D domain-containing protein [Pyrinomonadaceae bacterium]|jgi:hypothetical protein